EFFCYFFGKKVTAPRHEGKAIFSENGSWRHKVKAGMSMFRQANLTSNTLQLTIEARTGLSDEQTRGFTPVTDTFAVDCTYLDLYAFARWQGRDDIASRRCGRDSLAPFLFGLLLQAVAILIE